MGPFVPAGAADPSAIRELLRRATTTDGVEPISERFRIALARPPALLSRGAEGECTAYGMVLDDGAAELVVDPAWRRRGIGGGLLAALREATTVETVWAHGDLPAARGLARHLGLTRIRTLHLMSRPLTEAEVRPPAFPDGLTLRSFRDGDEDAWLAVNAAAFAHHPEQGRVDRATLAELMRQDWFAPEDLLLLWGPDGELAGSHWTKIDPTRTAPGPGGDAPAGEVYVVALAPRWQGRGLALPLMSAGLAHLAEKGLATVILYVDEENSAAMATYRRLGFASLATDAQYAVA
ncbi:MAG: mycothiol synthase [Dermatophilaceae bacterium]